MDTTMGPREDARVAAVLERLEEVVTDNARRLDRNYDIATQMQEKRPAPSWPQIVALILTFASVVAIPFIGWIHGIEQSVVTRDEVEKQFFAINEDRNRRFDMVMDAVSATNTSIETLKETVVMIRQRQAVNEEKIQNNTDALKKGGMKP
jgi:hypothetical protein